MACNLDQSSGNGASGSDISTMAASRQRWATGASKSMPPDGRRQQRFKGEGSLSLGLHLLIGQHLRQIVQPGHAGLTLRRLDLARLMLAHDVRSLIQDLYLS